MHLESGERLGHYEIIEQVGVGGMGVVYRARDTRVGRDVAVKVSSQHFTNRFEREARAVAALNHPNVCTLHDVGPAYLVMEFVDGESLKGPLPLQTALDYARQIADALDAAHQKGIVHRDLKPANIKVRSDGTVKVLDFGLATMESRANSGTSDLVGSQAMTVEGTQVGLIVGTVAYMSPEQACGKPVDKRTDIWAFGAVFYELLTGRRAFDGPDVPTIISAIIQSEPKWEGVPAQVRPVLDSCLEKDPRKRLRDIGDVWKLLANEPKPAARPSRGGIAGWVTAALLAIIAAVTLWAPWRVAQRESPQPLVRLDVDLGSQVALEPLTAPTFTSLIISPNGRRLAFVGAMAGGTPRLFVRRLDEPTVRELPGTEGAHDPFFSPDSEWVAFKTGGKLAKAPIDGGAVVPLADLAVMTGGSWIEDGSFVVASGLPGTIGLLRVPAGGGTPSPLLPLGKGELFYNYPQLLSDGKRVLVAVVGPPASVDTTNIEVVSLDGRERKTLLRGATSPRYLPSGHLLYASRAGMFALPFDINRLEARGPAVPIWPDAAFDPVTGGGQFDVSRDGTLVYRLNSGVSRTPMNIQWLDSTGKKESLLPNPGEYVGVPRLSPDAHRVAILIRDGGNHEIWIHDTQRGISTRVAKSASPFTPVWTRSGRHLIFGSMGLGMMWVRADGSVQPQVLLSTSLMMPTSVSAEGNRLMYQRMDGSAQLWSVELDENDLGLKAGVPSRFLTTPFSDAMASFSPDSHWVAYTSNETGRPEIYVRPFQPTFGGQEKVPISTGGGISPVWLPTRSELLYQSGNQIMAIDYTATQGLFVAGKPRIWAADIKGLAGFDVAPDGKRLAINVSTAPPQGPHQERTIVFLQNFLDELRRLAPTRPGEVR